MKNLKDCFCIQRYAGFQKDHVSKDFSVCMTQLCSFYFLIVKTIWLKILVIFLIEVSENYPLLWIKVKLFILSFPSSYLVETEFSAVNHVLPKKKQK